MHSTALTVRADVSSNAVSTVSAVSNVHRGWENAEFPIVCERCMGDNPYVRMQVDRFGGTCKMCERPFSLFKWRPGRNEGYKTTQVCQACARIKNLCQCCILDMQLGLPAQLRDAVLQHTDGIVSAESQKNRDYLVQQQLALLDDSGGMLGEAENEKLLQLARSASTNREQPRVKLVPGKMQTSSSSTEQKQLKAGPQHTTLKRKASEIETNPAMAVPPPLPPGITDVASLSKINMNQLPDHMKAFLNQHFSNSVTQSSNSSSNPSESNAVEAVVNETSVESRNSKQPKKAKAIPKPPPGPPPPTAFQMTDAIGKTNP